MIFGNPVTSLSIHALELFHDASWPENDPKAAGRDRARRIVRRLGSAFKTANSFPGFELGGEAAFEAIGQDGAKDHQAEHDLLGVALDSHQVHAVLDHGDDERAHQGAEDLTFTA